MALVTKGTAHLYGIIAGVGAIANATVLSFSTDSTHANVGETVSEIGNKIEHRTDDLTVTGTITIRARAAYAVLAAAAQITYDSVIYRINSVGRAEESQGFVTITYAIERNEYITLT